MLALGRMARGQFIVGSSEPYPLSRSKLQLFLECPRCFVLDRKHGAGRPDSPPFTLNNAVDALLKREFDGYRARAEPHPVMRLFGIEAVPFSHPELERWREPLRGGLRVIDSASKFEVTGAPDDLWVTPAGALIVVDYKATSSERTPSLDDPQRESYRRQLEVYQWLLRRLGFTVERTAYALFANADRTLASFDRTLKFTLTLSAYDGNDAWVDDALLAARDALEHDLLPPATTGCRWCAYRADALRAEASPPQW